MPMASELAGGGGSQIKERGTYLLSPGYIDSEAETGDGTKMIKICWEADEGSVWDNLVVKEGFPWKRMASLWFALGEKDRDFLTPEETAEACLSRLESGQRVYAVVKMEKYQGILGPKIAQYLPPGAATGDQLDEPPF